MEILNKEFAKYSKPMFFTIGRVIMYILGLLVILGTYSRISESQFMFVNFFVLGSIILIFVVYDIIVTIKKIKTYTSHMVSFHDNYLLFVDHRGTFKLPYEKMGSYQFISDQVIIRIKLNRFVISGKQHGILYEEIKHMVNFLISKKVTSKVNRNLIYFLGLFLVINYGADYLFRVVLEYSSDVSLFGTLYIIFAIVFGFFILEITSGKKLLEKEE